MNFMCYVTSWTRSLWRKAKVFLLLVSLSTWCPNPEVLCNILDLRQRSKRFYINVISRRFARNGKNWKWLWGTHDRANFPYFREIVIYTKALSHWLLFVNYFHSYICVEEMRNPFISQWFNEHKPYLRRIRKILF